MSEIRFGSRGLKIWDGADGLGLVYYLTGVEVENLSRSRVTLSFQLRTRGHDGRGDPAERTRTFSGETTRDAVDPAIAQRLLANPLSLRPGGSESGVLAFFTNRAMGADADTRVVITDTDSGDSAAVRVAADPVTIQLR